MRKGQAPKRFPSCSDCEEQSSYVVWDTFALFLWCLVLGAFTVHFPNKLYFLSMCHKDFFYVTSVLLFVYRTGFGYAVKLILFLLHNSLKNKDYFDFKLI